jgi:hypothetical protein
MPDHSQGSQTPGKDANNLPTRPRKGSQPGTSNNQFRPIKKGIEKNHEFTQIFKWVTGCDPHGVVRVLGADAYQGSEDPWLCEWYAPHT